MISRSTAILIAGIMLLCCIGILVFTFSESRMIAAEQERCPEEPFMETGECYLYEDVGDQQDYLGKEGGAFSRSDDDL